LLPRQFAEDFKRMLGDDFNINEFTVNVEKGFHQSVIHGVKSDAAGGAWNGAWEQFLGWNGENATIQRSAQEIGLFTQKMLDVLVSF
jgi:hypothetical protein